MSHYLITVYFSIENSTMPGFCCVTDTNFLIQILLCYQHLGEVL